MVRDGEKEIKERKEIHIRRRDSKKKATIKSEGIKTD